MMDAYGLFLQKVLFPAWEQGLRRRPTLRLLRYLEQTEWRPQEEILAIQLGELRKLLHHAYDHVPFYRARMDQAGAKPGDIKQVADLSRLAVLTRDEARETVEARTARGGPPVALRKSTSGTMGKPLAFGYDVGSEHWRQAIKLRGYRWAGYRLGDRSLHYWAPPMLAPPRAKQAKIAIDRALKREHYVDCTVRSEEELERVAHLIARVRPTVLLCFAQAGADLARFINERKLRRWKSIPVLCGAEKLYPADREALVEAFGPAIYETYGCREVMLIASECEAHEGLHLSSENLVVEVVVREGGTERPAQPGELGEVVITDLHNLAMPFIRYANGDMAVAADSRRCRCGRSLPKIMSVEGRVTETLRDGQGARVSSLLFNVIFVAFAKAVRQFQVVQHKDRSITLKLVPTGVFDPSVIEAIRAKCAEYLKGVEIKAEVVPEIPISKSGKRQVVFVET